MPQTLLAAFDSRAAADKAITALEEAGYESKDISVITKDTHDVERTTGADVAEGAGSGAATGGVIGGIAGLLAGAGVIPALTGLLIGGPIAAALGATGVVATTISGAVTGAVAGGLIGGLMGLGVSEEDARYYDETVNEGGVVVAVPVAEDDDDEARAILEEAHAGRSTSIEAAGVSAE